MVATVWNTTESQRIFQQAQTLMPGRTRAVTIPCNPAQTNPRAKENRDASHCTTNTNPEKVNPSRKINPCTKLAIREIKASQDSSGGGSRGFWTRIGVIDQRTDKFTDHFRF